MASFAGPLVTNLFLVAGYILMRPSATVPQKTIGFALAIGTLPLARWLALIDRGGDEIFTLRQIFTSNQYAAVLLGAFLVLLFTVPPVWRAMKLIKNKQALLILAGFLIIPCILDRLLIEKYFNGKLAASGLWMEPVYAGVPVIVVAWQIIITGAFLLSFQYLKGLSRKTVAFS